MFELFITLTLLCQPGVLCGQNIMTISPHGIPFQSQRECIMAGNEYVEHNKTSDIDIKFECEKID